MLASGGRAGARAGTDPTKIGNALARLSVRGEPAVDELGRFLAGHPVNINSFFLGFNSCLADSQRRIFFS
jgi:hypothetical protein